MDERARAWFQGFAPVRKVGTPKSGHKGHAGRPGRRGGSASRNAVLASIMRRGVAAVAPDQDYEQGMFESFLVDIEGDGRGIAKPNAEGSWAMMKHDTTHTEALAYEFAEAMGEKDLVPVTVTREVKGRQCSVQHWESDYSLALDLDENGWKNVNKTSFRRMVLMDGVLGNVDRHNANYLVHKRSGKVVAIDNGAAFYRKLSVGVSKGKTWGRHHVLQWKQAIGDKPIQFTEGDLKTIRKAIGNESLRDRVVSTIGPAAWAAVLKRAGQVLDHGTKEWK